MKDFTEMLTAENEKMFIGKKVCKKSGKPFKSMLLVNTIKGIVNHPIVNEPAFIFHEDDSFVAAVMCQFVDMCITETPLPNDDKGFGLVSNGKAEILVKEGRAVRVAEDRILNLFAKTEFNQFIVNRDNHTCYYCGNPGDTVDHKLPRSKGGHSTPKNCVCACFDCNQRKGNMTAKQFVALLRRENGQLIKLFTDSYGEKRNDWEGETFEVWTKRKSPDDKEIEMPFDHIEKMEYQKDKDIYVLTKRVDNIG